MCMHKCMHWRCNEYICCSFIFGRDHTQKRIFSPVHSTTSYYLVLGHLVLGPNVLISNRHMYNSQINIGLLYICIYWVCLHVYVIKSYARAHRLTEMAVFNESLIWLTKELSSWEKNTINFLIKNKTCTQYVGNRRYCFAIRPVWLKPTDD